MSEPDVISIRGAYEHNLKNVSLDIPKKKLVVFTGVSGCGKSSLAFDTLYAEGQRRYVESSRRTRGSSSGRWRSRSTTPSAGCRRPSPSSRRRRATTRARRWARSPRSTTTCACSTPRIGVQHCPNCGRKVGKQSGAADRRRDPRAAGGHQADAARAPGAEPQGRAQGPARGRAEARLRPGAHRRQGARARGEASSLDKKSKHDIELVVDRLVLKPDAAAAAHRLGRDGARARARACCIVTDETGAQVRPRDERAERLPPLRPLLRRADAGALLASTTRWACARTATAWAPSRRWTRT